MVGCRKHFPDHVDNRVQNTLPGSCIHRMYKAAPGRARVLEEVVRRSATLLQHSVEPDSHRSARCRSPRVGSGIWQRKIDDAFRPFCRRQPCEVHCEAHDWISGDVVVGDARPGEFVPRPFEHRARPHPPASPRKEVQARGLLEQQLERSVAHAPIGRGKGTR